MLVFLAGAFPPCHLSRDLCPALPLAALPAARPFTPPEQALLHCTRAVEYLRRSNHRNYLPRGLLTRAALYRLQNQLDLAHDDLQEALDIAQSSAMDFYQADAYLEQAALHLAMSRLAPHQDQVHQATTSIEEAKKLMHKMGYYRRHRQVTELEAMLPEAAAHSGAGAVTEHHPAT
jgi:tetratricopeptide (TPR) repeat protein